MRQLTILAPCKVNLTLDILSRRPDGYHEMDMIMQAVSLFDRLTLTPRTDGGSGLLLQCTRPDLSCGEDNIVSRCARGFWEHCGIPQEEQNIQVLLEKAIPVQAGLGGGSADGAGILAALNRWHGAGLSVEELCAIGAKYGADIPFCLFGGTARAQGIGEKLTRLPALPDCVFVVVKPRCAVSTGQAFAAFDDAGVDAHPDTEGALAALGRGDLPGLCERMENVFEELCQSQPQLEQVLQVRQELCRQGALAARMSGSGSAVFGVFAGPQQAMDCADRLEAAGQVESVHLAAPWVGGPVIEWEQSE